MYTIQSKNLLLNLTSQGILSVSHIDNTASALQLQLMPFQQEMETPFPYNQTVLTPLLADSQQKHHTQLPFIRWEIRQEGSLLYVEHTISRWTLSQQIRLSDDHCSVESFLHVPEGVHNPSSMDLFFTTFPGIWNQGKALLLSGSMGGNELKILNSAVVGESGGSPFVVQAEDFALSMYSDAGSSHPIRWVRGEAGWHGMVALAPEMDAGKQPVGCVHIEIGKCGQQLMERYADRYASKKPLKPAPKCWNSWDYYHSSISHEKILECTHALAADPIVKKNIDTIVMDMGWEVRHGEWVADPYFPKGMKAIADDIRKAGFQAGLWFAPIIIDPECNVFQDDYNFVGKNKYGFPDRAYECCGLFGYILDVTRKEGEEFLFNLFREYREMGYTYYKLDFLRYVMFVNRFQNGKLTNIQVMQKALKIIRDAVGEDSYILGCNLPFDVGPGYTDAARVTADVAVFWDAIRENAISLCATYFYNQKWWENDPDFLVVRGRDTFNADRYIYRTWWFPRQDQHSLSWGAALFNKLSPDATISLEEARVHASLEMVVGGSVVMGDPYQYLTEQARDILRKVIQAPTSAGKPLGIFEGDLPSRIWLQEMPGLTRIGLFNWQDYPITITLQQNKLGFAIDNLQANDFWTEEKLTLREGISFTLPARTCKVLEVKR